MKNLVIVESPAKAKTISKFLGSDYVVMASMGHVRDLPKSTLGFDPDDNFKPNYQISADKKKVIADLKKQISKDTTIYLAADEDREGEAIAWHLIPALKIEKNPIKRIVFHEITKDAILKALQNPRDVDRVVSRRKSPGAGFSRRGVPFLWSWFENLYWRGHPAHSSQYRYCRYLSRWKAK